ncbi:hypothetical protein E2C01_081268 [Portunus trituberculatus]|uniref:Uncharacterized protein n=1 Tax=Portunus trituberculatus TaxID=210409 RepID=A0A5B7IPA8_PORTR|nr:hypothetical protein [Portunus trituberculatus]
MPAPEAPRLLQVCKVLKTARPLRHIACLAPTHPLLPARAVTVNLGTLCSLGYMHVSQGYLDVVGYMERYMTYMTWPVCMRVHMQQGRKEGRKDFVSQKNIH